MPWRKRSIARSLSPRIGSIAVKSRKVALVSRSLPKLLSDLVVRPAWVISALSSSQSRYVVASTGSGADAPMEALDHAAWKNSSLVAMRSAVRDFIRSSSIKIISVSIGIREDIVSSSSISIGISDSIPSHEMPSEIFPRMSLADGYLLCT